MPETDVEAFRAIIVERFPELADATFALHTAGWDSVAVDVDDRLIFKFPRDEPAERALKREARLLAVIRPAVTMPVPDLAIDPGPPVFSRHVKLPGEHLVTAGYDRLPEAARHRLATDIARFYAELHTLDDRVAAAGSGPVGRWPEPDRILREAWPVLPEDLRSHAEQTVAAWVRLPPDPHGTTYGFFDGHGWNMAFDHEGEQLNGIYDFADSGFGPLHQEFIYTNFISPDLTSRIVSAYERATGLSLDRERIALLTSVQRISELAEVLRDPVRGPEILKSSVDWLRM